jgi:hypothetical protein
MTPEQVALCAQTADDIRKLDHKLKTTAFIIGQKLIAIKAQLDHGQFGPWLEKEVGYTDRTAQRYILAAESFRGKYDTVSLLPMKTVYEIAALPAQDRGEIVDMITDPQHPPIAQIKERLEAAQLKARRSRQEEQAAKRNAAIAHKMTPDALKAAEARAARLKKAADKQDAADAQRLEALPAQVVEWVNAIGREKAGELLRTIRDYGADRVVSAMAQALRGTAQVVADAPVNVVALDQAQINEVHDEELTDLDLTKAA